MSLITIDSKHDDQYLKDNFGSMQDFLSKTRAELIDGINNQDRKIFEKKNIIIQNHNITLEFSEFEGKFYLSMPNIFDIENNTMPYKIEIKNPLIANEAFIYACKMAFIIKNFQELQKIVSNYVKLSCELNSKSLG